MKISIITATYNSGNTVADTLKSVLAQSYHDYELLVIDGASKDNTLEIVKNMEPQFEGKLRYISEPDKGIYDAMNKGIKMATGEVVGILNSDDFYTSHDVLETVASKMLDKDVDAVYGDVHYVDDKNLTKCVRYYSSKPFHRWMMRLGFMPAHPSFYCRREVYEKFGSFDTSYRVAADFENLLRLIFVNHIRTRYIPKDFVTMRTGGASSSGWQSHKKIMKDHLKALRKNGVYSNIFLLALRYVYKILDLHGTDCLPDCTPESAKSYVKKYFFYGNVNTTLNQSKWGSTASQLIKRSTKVSAAILYKFALDSNLTLS